ncbi:MAG: NAD-dependent epimerase/dehydratase family protein [Acidimicrobiia bacterium]
MAPGPVAVTGAGGYVGGRLVAHLRGEGRPVRALARRPIPWLDETTAIDLVTADARALAEALEGCDAVVHLAGASEVRFAADPDAALAETVVAAQRVARAAADAGVERVIVASTVHVYGAALVPGARVDHRTLPAPRHPYAVARLAAEHLVAGLVPSPVALRLTNAVGAPVDGRVDRWTLVANELCARAARGEPLVLRSSGRQWRDFVDLGDVCAVLAGASDPAFPAGTYDLGSGTPTTVLALAELVAEVAGELTAHRPSIEAPAHDGPEPEPFRVSNAALAGLGHRPSTPLRDSIEETFRACLDDPPPG